MLSVLFSLVFQSDCFFVAVCQDGETALMIAFQSKHVEVDTIQVLLHNGADVNVKDEASLVFVVCLCRCLFLYQSFFVFVSIFLCFCLC